jgi:cytochrome c553
VKTFLYALLASACLLPSLMAATSGAKVRTAQATPTEVQAGTAAPTPASGAAAAQALGSTRGDPVLGREKADAERCIECHGVDGNGAGHSNGPEGKFAKLAGQHPDYILKQIRDFRSGTRQHDQMQIMARSVSDADVRDIAAYFSSQPIRSSPDGQRQGPGQALYDSGDPARGLPACAGCHGTLGKGVAGSPLTPVIGGQEWRYLDQQLRNWRSGERRNSPDGAMSQMAKALTDADIQALADYLSGL